MAGQGRNADGLIGPHPPDAVNVVRFPGDWFGPLSDLVTVGTDADDVRDDDDRFVREPADNAAGAFWGEDAADDQEVGKATQGVRSPEEAAHTPKLAANRRSSRWQWATPIGCAFVAVVAFLSAGANATQPAQTSYRHPARHATVKPAVTPEVKIRVGRKSPAGLDPRHRDKALDDRPASRASRRLSLVPSSARRPTRTVVGAGTPRITATATTGDIDSPTGVVTPPPSATQANP